MFPSLLPLAVLLSLPFSVLTPPSTSPPGIAPLVELNKQHGTSLKLGAGDTLRNLRVMTLPNGSVAHVNRFHQGVPVLGESATLHFDVEGNLTRILTDFSPLEILLEPVLSAVEARIIAVEAIWGVHLPKTLFQQNAFDDSLAIDGRTGRWIYSVFVPGILPNQSRTVWIDAHSGRVSRLRNQSLHAEAPANVFIPHPDPRGDLSDTTPVTLKNLLGETNLRGAWVNSHNCLTDETHRQVYTCDDILPIFAGQMGLGNVSCTDPLVASFVGEFKNTVITLCGPTHKASPEGEEGYLRYQPVEPDTSRSGFFDPAFEDEFAEIGLYYHIDRASVWFQALGHPAPTVPLDGAVNISSPSGDLLACTRGEMEAQNASDHDTGVQSTTACLEEMERVDTPPFAAIPNAFFSPAGPMTSLLGFDNGGIFFFQGPTADFAYDGDVVYHEFGHNIVHQSGNNILTGGNLMDPYGLDDSPGALNEAYADYFAGALTEDPVVGGYAGYHSGLGEGIRRMDHELRCPDFWAGEVHADAWGWAGALWAGRALSPQSGTDDTTGLEFRLFDRAVLSGLKTLTENATYAQAAEATLHAVSADAELEDADAALLRAVFTDRNVLHCERVRSLSPATPIEQLFLVAGNTTPSPQDLLGGSQSFTPYAPPPVQFKIEVPDLKEGEAAPECATFAATLADAGAPSEGVPDLLGGGGESDTAPYQLKLLFNSEGPVEFSYSGNVSVNSPQSANVIDVSFTPQGALFTAPLYFGPDTATLYYALVNGGPAARLSNIRLINLNEDCHNPSPPTPQEPVRPIMVEDELSPEDTGCGCTTTSPSSLMLVGLFGIALLRRRRPTPVKA